MVNAGLSCETMGMMLQGASVYILGRLAGSRAHINSILVGMGARLCSRPSSRVTHTIVAHSVAERFSGRTVGHALSELTFKRLLGILPPPEANGRAFTKPDVTRISGLGDDLIDRLILFDILDPCDGLFCYRDVASARTVARLLGEGVSEKSVLVTGARLRSKGMRISEARLEGVSDTLMLAYGNGRMTIDGQFELPLLDEPIDPDDLVEQALDHEDMDQWEEAEQLYRMLCSMVPSDPHFPFGLGTSLFHQGKLLEAINAYMESYRRDNHFADPVFNIGTIREDRGEIDEAIRSYRKALAIDPSHTAARFNLARLLTNAEEYSEALTHWNIIGDTNSDDKQIARKAALLCRLELATS